MLGKTALGILLQWLNLEKFKGNLEEKKGGGKLRNTK